MGPDSPILLILDLDETLVYATEEPLARRSASKSLRTMARGSRLDLSKGGTVRFFLWSRNGEDRTDIDLSAVLLAGDWKRLGYVAYFILPGILPQR